MRYLFYLIAMAVQLTAATVYYIPGYGESTSVGNYGGPAAISSSQPYSNQMLNGGQTAFIPLVENTPYTGFNGLSGTQESPLSGALNNLTLLARASGGDYVVIANNYGVGSQTIADLSKADPYGTGHYAAFLAGVTAAWNVAAAAGNTLVVPGVLLTLGGNDWASGCHGCPTDPSRGQDNFKALSVTLQANLEADIKAITGQTQHVVVFFSQQNLSQMTSVGSGGYPGSGGATLYACPDTQIACVGDPTGQAAPLVPQAQYELARDYPSLFYFFLIT